MVEVIQFGRTDELTGYDYESFAVLINVLDAAVDYLLLTTVFLGYFFLAAGLSSRFAPGKRRSLNIGISLMSLVALVLVLIGYHYQELAVLVGVGALGLIPAVAWLITLGVWLYRQDSALVGDPESA